MNKPYNVFLGLLLLASSGFASVALADGATSLNTDSRDFPTVEVSNYTLYPESSNHWSTAISGVSDGQLISVNIYYHNSGANVADNVRLRMSQPSGSASSFTFSGSVSADNANTANGVATVNLTSAQTLTFVPGSLAWRPNQCTSSACTTPLPNGQNEMAIFSNGVTIGNIAPGWPSQGNLVMLFRVGSTQQQQPPVISSFYASPSNVTSGQPSTLFWTVQNADTCTLSGGIFNNTSVSNTGGNLTTGVLTNTTNYTLNCANAAGNSPRSTSVTVSAAQQLPVISSFYASPSSINYNQTTQLYWTVTNADICTISRGGYSTNVSPNGAPYTTANLTQTSTYTIVCSNSAGSDTRTTVVTVDSNQNNVLITNFSASPTTVNYGGSSVLSWNSQNASYCTASGAGGWNGTKSTANSETVYNLYNSQNYVLTCYDGNGNQASQSAYVTVTNQIPNQTSTIDYFYATPNSVSNGSSATLYWGTSYMQSCYATGDWSGTQSVNSSYPTGALYNYRTYTLNCNGNQGLVARTVNVSVSTPIATTLNFYADATYLNYNNTGTTLHWSTNGVGNCYASGDWSGTQAGSGQYFTGRLYTTRTYTLNCNGVVQSITVTVANQSQLPTVVTSPATGISATGATLNGYLVQGGQNATTWFEYGTTPSLGNITAYIGDYNTSSFARFVSGLAPNTTYYFRANAQNASGQAHGSILSFTTLSGGYVPLPDVSYSRVSISKEVRNLSFPNGVLTAIAAWAGNTIQYSITVTNTGTNVAQNLSVSDALPNGVTFKQASAGGTLDSAGAVRWNISSLGVGESAKLTVDTTAGLFNENIVATNMAKVTGSQITSRTSNSVLAIINLYPFILTINTNQEVVGKGEVVNFTVLYKNEGEANLTNVVLRVILPAGMTLDGSDLPGFTQDKNVLTWGLGSLAPKASGQFNLRARVEGELPADLKLTTSAVANYFDAFSERQRDVNSYKTITVDPNKKIDASVSGNTTNVAASGLAGFFPSTLTGWLLLILLLVILAVLIKRAFDSRQDA